MLAILAYKLEIPVWGKRNFAIEMQLGNIKAFYEFLYSKKIYVPLVIYYPGELEVFTDWKSFEAATLAAIGRLEDEPN